MVGVGLGGVEGGSLIEELDEEIALGRSAGGQDGRGLVGEVEVEEDGGDDGRIGQKGEDGHVATAGGTQELAARGRCAREGRPGGFGPVR